ncbi:MAG: Gfo/Idh/MocA family oxidoreductase [Kiritimatiellae bacterium]|nr:Gfo/Idh/MocA family oxidoreductase [Kiritimatiellia bacterium]
MGRADRLRVLVVGCGHMGSSHARAYQELASFEIVGLVSRGPRTREALASELGGGLPLFSDFETALESTRPDVVSINTYPDTHEAYACRALRAGCHVFLEKPVATTVRGARRVINTARQMRRKLVVGYILRHHPSWIRFIRIARTLGKPVVMRMNLNQQSKGETWETHKNLLRCASPLVDCGVHYVDVMCQITRANPVRVFAIGARLANDISPNMYNYGQLEVVFDDGSVGWYEAGWGPMMSETAHFIKDVIGPRGAVSMVPRPAPAGSTDEVASHTRAQRLLIHESCTSGAGSFTKRDRILELRSEPDHDDLCRREQQFLLRAIREDLDLNDHWKDAVNSLRIVLAADRSVRTGRVMILH